LVIFGWFFRRLYLPAWVLLIVWIGLQFLNQMAEPLQLVEGGVAHAAHIGGFMAGFVLIPVFKKYRRKTHFRYTDR
jgi:membrane associated rhomboid family serine protease